MSLPCNLLLDRYHIDFMFELTDTEIDIMVSHFVIPSKQVLGGAKPFAFAETDNNIMLIFEYIKQFEEAEQQELEQKNRKRIGY